MLPVQQELHKVSVELREKLVVGLVYLYDDPDRALLVRHRCEGSTHHMPSFRIKYMNTAGGLQVGFHDVVGNGLGSGQYLPFPNTVEILELMITKIQQRIESQDRLADTFQQESQRVVDIDIIMIDESKQSIERNSHLSFDDIFPNPEVDRLDLPNQLEDIKSHVYPVQ